MLAHEFLHDRGILILKPSGALRANDFTALAAVVDPYIEQHGGLKGLMIEARSFPGWENFGAMLSHLRLYAIIIDKSGASPWCRTARYSRWHRKSRATS